jgi:hypothetical protein
VSLDEGQGIKGFKRVQNDDGSPGTFDDPFANSVPNEGARIKIAWNGAGEGRGESDVGEESQHDCGRKPLAGDGEFGYPWSGGLGDRGYQWDAVPFCGFVLTIPRASSASAFMESKRGLTSS